MVERIGTHAFTITTSSLGEIKTDDPLFALGQSNRLLQAALSCSFFNGFVHSLILDSRVFDSVNNFLLYQSISAIFLNVVWNLISMAAALPASAASAEAFLRPFMTKLNHCVNVLASDSGPTTEVINRYVMIDSFQEQLMTYNNS